MYILNEINLTNINGPTVSNLWYTFPKFGVSISYLYVGQLNNYNNLDKINNYILSKHEIKL